MLSWLTRRRTPQEQPSAAGYLAPARSQDLLNTPRRQQLLENIWHRASMSRPQFKLLYQGPLERYAELVQLLPASENHHHSHRGGMLDHGLEIVAYALKIRQTYLLPIGAPPEAQSAQAEAWSAAAAYGALIHDLGKIAVDIHVELQGGKTWHPWHGPISTPYRFKYVNGREYQLHAAATALIYGQILTPEILDWLSGFSELWKPLIYVIAGQYEHAGILGEIVVKADQASVAQELGGNPDRALAAPKQSLQRQLADGLRHIVRDKFKLNHPGGPSDGWFAQDALWLVSKPIADQLRAYLLTQGIEGVPSSNAPFFNMLQDQGIIQTNDQNKAVWKIDVDNGNGWKNSFTVLKVAPSLIWADHNERPESYTGTLAIHSGNTDVHEETTEPVPQPSTKLKQPKLLSDPPLSHDDSIFFAGTTPREHSAPLTPSSESPPAQTDVSDELSELLALYNDINRPLHDSEVEAATNSGLDHTDSAVALPQDPAKVGQDSNVIAEDVLTMPKINAELIGDLGQGFVEWLRTGISTRRIIINDAKALVHTVDGTAYLVSPGIFKRYTLEFPEVEQKSKKANTSSWQLVQRSFEKLKAHRKTSNSLNIWSCKVKGPRKTRSLRGYLLRDPHLIFTEVPFDNASLILETGTEEAKA